MTSTATTCREDRVAAMLARRNEQRQTVTVETIPAGSFILLPVDLVGETYLPAGTRVRVRVCETFARPANNDRNHGVRVYVSADKCQAFAVRTGTLVRVAS